MRVSFQNFTEQDCVILHKSSEGKVGRSLSYKSCCKNSEYPGLAQSWWLKLILSVSAMNELSSFNVSLSLSSAPRLLA